MELTNLNHMMTSYPQVLYICGISKNDNTSKDNNNDDKTNNMREDCIYVISN